MAVGVAKVSIKIEGLDPIIKALQSNNPIYAEPWKKALYKAVQLGAKAVKSRAPVLTGTLRSSVTTRLDSRTVPLYGLVSMGATSAGGARYGFTLDAGKGKKDKSGANSVTHYRSGVKAGRPTRRWFRGSLTVIRKEVNMLLSGAAREIEARWGR